MIREASREVVVVSRSVPPDVGGYQRQFGLVFPRLVQRGMRVWAIGAVRTRPPEGSATGWTGVKTACVPVWRLWRNARAIGDLVVLAGAVTRLLSDVIRRRRPTLFLVSPTMLGGAVLAAIATRLGGKVVIRFPTPGDADRFGRAPFVNAIDNKRVQFLVMSPGQRQEVISALRLEPRIEVNGVESVASAPPPSEARRILYVGRLIARKRIDLLLEAWARCASDLPGWSLVIAGGGQGERDSVEADLRRAGLGLDRVEFLGEVSDGRGVLAEGGVLVHPGSTEGQPNAILEAMAAGVPLVASRAAVDAWFGEGTPFVEWDGKSSETLATILQHAAVSPADVDAIAEASRRHVAERHSLESVTSSYWELLAES